MTALAAFPVYFSIAACGDAARFNGWIIPLFGKMRVRSVKRRLEALGALELLVKHRLRAGFELVSHFTLPSYAYTTV